VGGLHRAKSQFRKLGAKPRHVSFEDFVRIWVHLDIAAKVDEEEPASSQVFGDLGELIFF